MSNQRKSETILEFYRRAVAARRFATACHDPAERADLLEVARRWQRLACHHPDKFESTEIMELPQRLAN